MAEYTNVEQPFLAKLRQLQWEVIDHGCGGIPQEPKISLRQSFREVLLEGVFRESVKRINRTEDGREWLTEKQLDEVWREISQHPGKPLLEANRTIFDLLTANTTVASMISGTKRASPTKAITERTNSVTMNQTSCVQVGMNEWIFINRSSFELSREKRRMNCSQKKR